MLGNRSQRNKAALLIDQHEHLYASDKNNLWTEGTSAWTQFPRISYRSEVIGCKYTGKKRENEKYNEKEREQALFTLDY